MNIDYLVVGCGLAGINFCELLLTNNKSFVVFDNDSQHSSTVAGGLYNPVVLKRFTPVWKSETQLSLVNGVYGGIEKRLGEKINHKLPVRRVFHSLEEQNNWFVASDKKGLSQFLSPNLLRNDNPNILAPYGFGEVLHTGRIDTSILISRYFDYLFKLKKLRKESFDYNAVVFDKGSIGYKDLKTKHIVFAEGFGIKHNPFFNDLPLKGTKGELLTIYAPKLQMDYVLKSNVFLIPLEEQHYLVGATYEWEDKSNTPTEKGKNELLSKLETVINCPFEVVNQQAGIRPTVIDRRPLVGTHKTYEGLHILNGLGTRGVMIAPYAAKALYEFIEYEKDLEIELNINRF